MMRIFCFIFGHTWYFDDGTDGYDWCNDCGKEKNEFHCGGRML